MGQVLNFGEARQAFFLGRARLLPSPAEWMLRARPILLPYGRVASAMPVVAATKGVWAFSNGVLDVVKKRQVWACGGQIPTSDLLGWKGLLAPLAAMAAHRSGAFEVEAFEHSGAIMYWGARGISGNRSIIREAAADYVALLPVHGNEVDFTPALRGFLDLMDDLGLPTTDMLDIDIRVALSQIDPPA